MRKSFLGRMIAVAALVAGAAMANSNNAPNQPVSDEQLNKAVRHEILMYPYYGIYDEVGFQVANGQVVLSGAVTLPVKKSDLGRAVQHIPGVTSVTNNLEVLPLSPNDNRLRQQVARAIYGFPSLSRYGWGTHPSIHIIVENGHVTLSGTVDNEADKQVAALRASGAGMSFGQIVNNLQVAQPSRKS